MDEYISVDAVAKKLGVSKQTVYRWIAKKHLPFIVKNIHPDPAIKTLRIEAKSFNDWLSGNSVDMKSGKKSGQKRNKKAK